MLNDITEIDLTKNTFSLTDLVIRAMEVQDLRRVCDLERSCFQAPWSEKSLADEILENPRSRTFVVLKNGVVIGYALYWHIDMEAHLARITINRGFRRKNIGSFLLNYLIKDIQNRNISVVYLEVRRSNIAAQNLYLKHGFLIDGVRKNYYLDENEDAILMSLPLKEG